MAGSKSTSVAFMVVITMMIASTAMAQTRHVVGDALGWTIPPNGAYTTWASQQTFNVGDSLFFNFTTGLHNVAEVSQAAYGPCTTANPISITSSGPATITLTTPGTHYFICTVGTHCQIGQKVAINVSATTAAPPTATPPPAAAPPTTTSPPAATPTPTPTPAPVSPPTTTPTSSPSPSPTTPPPTTSPAPSPVESGPTSPTTPGSSPSGTPTPASDITPPPPSPSAASRSFTAALPAAFLAVALAFFY